MDAHPRQGLFPSSNLWPGMPTRNRSFAPLNALSGQANLTNKPATAEIEKTGTNANVTTRNASTHMNAARSGASVLKDNAGATLKTVSGAASLGRRTGTARVDTVTARAGVTNWFSRTELTAQQSNSPVVPKTSKATTAPVASDSNLTELETEGNPFYG